ncbi:MAG: hypothetical protein Q9160_002175 [Pyrenula sp. 1 TL-2023]
MSQPGQNTSLSLSARLTCYLGPPATVLLTSLASPKAGLLSPLACLPTAGFYLKWREANRKDPSKRAELEPLVWTYVVQGTLGVSVVLLAQMGICRIASSLLFESDLMRKDFWQEFGRSTISGLTPTQLSYRSQLASSWQNWVFNAALSFIAAGLFEETLKYLPIAYARRRERKAEATEPNRRRSRAYLDYVLAGALSFGLNETLLTLFSACQNETGSKLAVTVSERLVFGCLGHLLPAVLTALRAIRRDYCGDQLSWWSVVGPSALLHGTFDFLVFSFSALEGNVGWIHPTGLRNVTAMLGLCSGVIGTAAWLVKQEWDDLKYRFGKW